MSTPALVVLLALLVADVLLIWAFASRRRVGDLARQGLLAVPAGPVDLDLEVMPGGEVETAVGSGIRAETYDRVIRIASYIFLLVTAIVVSAGGLWPAEAPTIYMLLLAGAITVFVLNELAPRAAGTETLRLAEGVAAVIFLTLLIVLTGGVMSPFFAGYFLVVAAAALVTGGGASLLMAAGITAAYLVAILVSGAGATSTTEEAAVAIVDLVSLWLLSYLASVVAAEQRRTRDAALRLSLFDPLTRLYNRTFLFAAIEREIARAGRTDRRFSLLMLDLDGLKPINDRYGHYFGDRMLQAVGEAVRQGIRIIDSAARYGGDEFVVLLPETDVDGAAVVAEKLRRSVAAIRLAAGTDVLNTTASIGIVSYPDDGGTADALTNSADQVMYAAKRAGRNRVSRQRQVARSGRNGPATGGADRRARAGGTAARSTGPGRAQRRADHSRSRPRHAESEPGDGGRRPAVSAATPAAEPYPSMFADRYPALIRWTPGRQPEEPAPMLASNPGRGSAAVPAAATRQPTTRARRFRIEHQHDRTFERTMRRFLSGRPDAPRPRSVERDPTAD